MNTTVSTTATHPEREDFRQRLAELRMTVGRPAADAVDRYTDLEDRFAALAHEVYTRLLESPLAWTPEEHADATWICRTSRELALIAYRTWQALAATPVADPRASHFAARSLLHMGNSAKWDGVVSKDGARDFRKPHALMRFAIAADCHRSPVRITLAERVVECSIEALYFRALLLARFASGAFGFKQLEILDQWMWLWTPVLQGCAAIPQGGSFCADLASNEGLRPGDCERGPSTLYLPIIPIQRAYTAIVAEFHAGRIVPAEGIASRFRVEEHVAVLELARNGLREISIAPAKRADRHDLDEAAELFLGLGDVVNKAFAPTPAAAPVAGPSLELVTSDDERAAAQRRTKDRAIDGAYERERRMVRVANVSTTGFGIEGPAALLDALQVGDLVALRIARVPAPHLCKVSRRTPLPGGEKISIGLHRISSEAILSPVAGVGPPDNPGIVVPAVFVPGDDSSGRYDAWLVSERDFAKRPALEVQAGRRGFTLRLNRVRDRGPGWVLAGFEVTAEQKAA